MRKWLAIAAVVGVMLAPSLSSEASPAFDSQVAALGRLDPQQDSAAFADAVLALAPATPQDRQTSATLKLAAGDSVLAAGGSVATATRLYDAALADLAAGRSAMDSTLVDPLRHIGEKLLAANQVTAAVPYLRRALTIMRSTSAADPALRFVLADLADAADRQGDSAEAGRLRAEIATLESQARDGRQPLEKSAAESSGGAAPPPPPPPPPPPLPEAAAPTGAPHHHAHAAARPEIMRSAARPQEPFQIVPVFFQTTRKPKGAYEFGTERDTNVSSGVAYVSVPRQRAIGSVPRPSVWRLDFIEDPARHVILRDIEKLGGDAFGARLAATIARSGRGEALVFVHGFNQSFDDGVETAATLAVDLEIDGATIAFSWPSKENLFAYGADVDEVEAAANRRALGALLVRAAHLGARHVYLVAHSMGNRLLLNAMTDAKDALRAGRPFDQVIFGSPDVDATDFSRRVRDLAGISRHMTLYAGATDRALMLSGFVHGGARRAGDVAANVPATASLEVVDATLASEDFLGHDDYAWLARDDLRALVWFGILPLKRCVLQAEPLPRWKYQPSQACPSGAFRAAAEYLRRAANFQGAMAAIGNDTPQQAGLSEADMTLARAILRSLGQ